MKVRQFTKANKLKNAHYYIRRIYLRKIKKIKQ